MDELLPKLAKRIQPRNGLAINAMVWQEAHDYHRFHHQAHLRFSHGPGIVTGLEIRHEPQSRRLWVQPGLAVNALGQLMVLEEQECTELEPDQVGLVYLFLTSGRESEWRGTGPQGGKDPLYVRQGCVLESALSLPETAVELARFRLSAARSPVNDAVNQAQPGPDEIDLRFRPQIGAKPQSVAALAICYLGQAARSLPKYGPKAGQLAHALSHLTHHPVWIDDDVALTAGLQPYTLVYLIEDGPSKLTWTDIEALQSYLRAGGVLFIESYQAEAGQSALLEVLASHDLKLSDTLPDDLLVSPFLFSQPPPGFNPQGGTIQMGQGVIFSTRDYGHLWQRTHSNDLARSREAIRAAVEWAANLITYAVHHRWQFNDSLIN